MVEWRHTAAGALTTSSVTFLLQPIDVVKTTFLVNRKSQIQQNIQYIYKSHGYRGFWKGLVPALYRSLSAGAITFTTFEYLLYLSDISDSKGKKFAELGTLSAFSRFVSILGTCPLTVIKVRMEAAGTQHYPNFSSAFKTIVEKEGFRGLYKGLVPLCVRDIPYMFFTFGFIGLYSNIFREKFGVDTSQFWPNYIIGALAGMTTTVLTQPCDVLKIRMQYSYVNKETTLQYTGIYDAFSKILKYEGVGGLWRGVTLRMCEKMLSAGIIWGTYSNIRYLLLGKECPIQQYKLEWYV